MMQRGIFTRSRLARGIARRALLRVLRWTELPKMIHGHTHIACYEKDS